MSSVPTFEKVLNRGISTITIGKDPGCNDLPVKDSQVSRRHCTLQFDGSKGGVYAIDSSTNGTFLNGLALPPKNSGKVLLSHGDELILKTKEQDPKQEFGWIVSISVLAVKKEEVLTAPRRIVEG